MGTESAVQEPWNSPRFVVDMLMALGVDSQDKV